MTADEDKRIDKKAEQGIDRRTFVTKGLLAGGALLGGGLAISRLADADDGSDASQTPPPAPAPARTAASRRPVRPNILVIMVDQLRYPQWLGAGPGELELPPNLQQLSQGAVSFANHYTASNDCTPARSALLTGLYTHQTGCMITGGSTLDPAFRLGGRCCANTAMTRAGTASGISPTGTTSGPPHGGRARWSATASPAAPTPRPTGRPARAGASIPASPASSQQWLATAGESEPWCTTVSFVNPHDIAWWYKWTDRVPAEASAPSVATQLPPNFETPEQLIARGKPRLQLSLQETSAASFGPVPFTGPEAQQAWLEMLDLYVKLQLEVDEHVGRVLDALESRPQVAANTVVVVTSDHGEYGGSHGLRGKGAGAYDEAIRVPLLVSDPRGKLTSAPEQPRTQLTSSVDVAPLLLTIASGSDEWRSERRYEHLAQRPDLASILADPSAPGRDYVLHATDETVTEFAIEPYAADAPLHVVALRTPQAKFATYSNWEGEQIAPLAEGQERELYDYSERKRALGAAQRRRRKPAGRPAAGRCSRRRYTQELRQPLPRHLQHAQARGFDNYFTVVVRSTLRAYERREQELAAAAAAARASALDRPASARSPRRPRRAPGRQRTRAQRKGGWRSETRAWEPSRRAQARSRRSRLAPARRRLPSRRSSWRRPSGRRRRETGRRSKVDWWDGRSKARGRS